MKFIFLILECGLLSFGLDLNAQTLKLRIETQYSTYAGYQNELIKEYDENGNLIKQVFKDFSGIPTRTSFYIVDAKGRMTSDSTFNPDNILVEVCAYEYNDKDDIIFQKRLFIETSAYYEERYDRTYDPDGNEIEVKQFNKEGELEWIYKYKYDSNGNEINRLSYYKGTAKEEWRKKYKKGHCINAKNYLFENDKFKRIEFGHYYYEYNKQGQMVKKTVIEQNVVDVLDYTYDENGDMIEEKTTKNGNLISINRIKSIYW